MSRYRITVERTLSVEVFKDFDAETADAAFRIARDELRDLVKGGATVGAPSWLTADDTGWHAVPMSEMHVIDHDLVDVTCIAKDDVVVDWVACPCPNCDGAGTVALGDTDDGMPCPRCGGSGAAPASRG